MIPTVRSSYRDALIKFDGIDPTTGEEVPGMAQTVGTPTLTVKPTEYGRSLAANFVGSALGTADEWAKQRDGVAEAAAKLSETMSISPTEALRIVTEATDHIGTRKLTADEWGKRIDRDKLAEMLKPYFNGGDVAYGEHVECAEAVLAALPELMGGAS